MDYWTVGSGYAPRWCKKRVEPYQKMDGTVGYVFSGKKRDFELVKGDVLEHDGSRIYVKRCEHG